MKLKVAINGFGRIGRMVLRSLVEKGSNSPIEIVAINDLGSIHTNAHLLKYDSVHGRFPNPIHIHDHALDVGMGPIHVFNQATPLTLPWAELGVDLVMECSGHFTDREKASAHLKAGAKRVLVSAPTTHADLTVVYGVNHDQLTSSHHVVSCGSCTTNCLAPIASILHESIGIQHGYMTTIHAYTGDQRLVDTLHSDLYRARAATLSMIPTSTGAAKAIGLVIPALQGKLDGSAIRVPTANVSLIDFKFTSTRPTSVAEINAVITKAASAHMSSILCSVDEPLVSIDFNHSPYSSNFDTTQTHVIEGHFCRVVSWYDNEWGFSNRMGDVALHMGQLISK